MHAVNELDSDRSKAVVGTAAEGVNKGLDELLVVNDMRMPQPCTVHRIRGRTRVGLRVPWRGGAKGGVSGPAEDLRPVSEVEAGVNFRPAGGLRGQVAGSLPRKQPGTGTRRVREGVDTPSLHPEGFWYPIRVTWTRIGHQTINGLDEGV